MQRNISRILTAYYNGPRIIGSFIAVYTERAAKITEVNMGKVLEFHRFFLQFRDDTSISSLSSTNVVPCKHKRRLYSLISLRSG